MILPFSQLKVIEPRVHSLEEAPISLAAGATCGWHCSVVGEDGAALGSGLHADREVSQRVAIAETIERALYRRITADPKLYKDFLLQDFPSSCGFAAGFDAASTRRRAVAEALERWAWSKWIDEGFGVPQTHLSQPPISSLTEAILGNFDSFRLYEQPVETQDLSGTPQRLKFSVVVGFKDGGAFPGSRVSAANEDGTEHAAIEAWRHWTIFKNLSGPRPDDLVNGRIHHFGKNGRAAESAIARATHQEWPEPKLQLSKHLVVSLQNGLDIHLSRALCSDYRGWHEGDVGRFVY